MYKHLNTNQYQHRNCTMGDKKTSETQEQHITHRSQRLGVGGGEGVVF